MISGYRFESGDIDKVSTNRLVDIQHEATLQEYYTLHPELCDIWELGSQLEASQSVEHKKCGRALHRIGYMLSSEGSTKTLAHIIKYSKSLNMRLMLNKNNPINYQFALEFVYNTVNKGLNVWKDSIRK